MLETHLIISSDNFSLSNVLETNAIDWTNYLNPLLSLRHVYASQKKGLTRNLRLSQNRSKS